MKFKQLSMEGVFEIQLDPRRDERGYFMRAYDDKLFGEHGIHREWVQENESFSVQKGTLRGLHLQAPPDAEGKLVRLLSGEAFFAFVDLRKGSPTFCKWEGVTLSFENKKMLFIPRGFALGMCTLTDNSILYYKMDNYYAPESTDEIKWNDPSIGIKWPIEKPAVMSTRDENAKSLKEFLEIRCALEA